MPQAIFTREKSGFVFCTCECLDAAAGILGITR
jgi:hypothetical protein